LIPFHLLFSAFFSLASVKDTTHREAEKGESRKEILLLHQKNNNKPVVGPKGGGRGVGRLQGVAFWLRFRFRRRRSQKSKTRSRSQGISKAITGRTRKIVNSKCRGYIISLYIYMGKRLKAKKRGNYNTIFFYSFHFLPAGQRQLAAKRG